MVGKMEWKEKSERGHHHHAKTEAMWHRERRSMTEAAWESNVAWGEKG